ncbi:hypothetical protein [Pilimelia columellifera]|uniref:Uncharacterized protein n=1 Tax=Pilimelia columellifera subsp. columellifera TaxID=706583 RepID=A0ABN3N936_9ACTN
MGRTARIVVWATGAALLALAAVFWQLGPVIGNYPAQALGALAGVAGVGVAVWATLRGGQPPTRRVTRSGDGITIGSDNTVVTGAVGGDGGVSVKDSGDGVTIGTGSTVVTGAGAVEGDSGR